MVNTKGFTLIEIIIVVVIIGLLASLAMPRLSGQKEIAIFSEGVTAAQTLYGAQQRYQLDHSAYAGDCSSLDVDLSPKNFTVTCSAATPIVSVARSGGPVYTIMVSDAGVYSCTECVDSLAYLEKYIPY